MIVVTIRNIVDVPPITPYNKERIQNTAQKNAANITIIDDPRIVEMNPISVPLYINTTILSQNSRKTNQ